MRLLILTICVLSLISCEAPPKQTSTETVAPKPAAKPKDESRRFPQPNLVSTEVIGSALLGQPFMPGGTLARYKKGKVEYQMFVAETASASDAAIKISEWRTALTNPEFVASFGGYFGHDAAVPVFVFSKGAWIAGVVGLPRSEADAVSRTLASRL